MINHRAPVGLHNFSTLAILLPTRRRTIVARLMSAPFRLLEEKLRLARRLALCLLAGAIVAACATKPAKKPSGDSAAPAKPGPTPAVESPSSPASTPEVHYTATVRIEGADPSEQTKPTPAATPSPSPSPRPTPAPSPAAGNFLSRSWAKVFRPKSTPSPTPGDLGEVRFHVSTDGERAPAMPPDPAPSATPAPASITPPAPPAENLLGRLWHRIFPRKQTPPAAAPAEWIGTIRLVNARENYVLVDAPNYLSLAAGETLNSVGAASESGVLRASADRNPPFFIADIVSGHPRAGDRIYSPKPAGSSR